MMENKELIDLLIRIVFVVISVVITSYLKPWLKSLENNEKFDNLLIFVEKCVQSAEKIYTAEEWKQKKAYVLDLVIKKVNEIGIDIDATEIDVLIEGMVKEVKG